MANHTHALKQSNKDLHHPNSSWRITMDWGEK